MLITLITLTDKFPNTNAYKHLKEKNKNQIDFLDDSIDAKNVPEDIKGLRTMFSAIHHFDPDTIIKILDSSNKCNF